MLLRNDISTNQLLLRLYDKPLHPELFDVRHRKQIEAPECDIDFWVTGCSHLISIQTKTACATEFLGTSNQGTLPANQIDAFKLKGPKNRYYNFGDNEIRYQLEFDIESVSENIYSYIHDELKRTALRQKHLFLDLDIEDTFSNLRPFCYATLWRTFDKTQISVCHGYPAEMKILRTQSLFEIK